MSFPGFTSSYFDIHSILTHPANADDITQEAMRHIANKRHDAANVAHEKAVLDAMRRLEYQALTKCAHGHPSDERQWTEFQRQYNSEFLKTNYWLGVLHTKQLCSKCVEEERERERNEICRVAEIEFMERQIAELQSKIAVLKRCA